MKKILSIFIILILFSLFIGCGDDEEKTNYYIRFTINGTNYSFEQGVSGINPNNGTNLEGCPAAYNFDSPGMLPMDVYATKLQLPVDDLSKKTNGFFKFTVNTDCTNTNQYNNVSFRFKHPDLDGTYYQNGQSVNITEIGDVISGTFSVTLTNQTQLNEFVIESGTFRVKRLEKNAGHLIINNL